MTSNPMTEVRVTPMGRAVTRAEAIAAARVLVAVSQKRGREPEPWVLRLAEEGRR